jgi:hypothetical protein
MASYPEMAQWQCDLAPLDLHGGARLGQIGKGPGLVWACDHRCSIAVLQNIELFRRRPSRIERYWHNAQLVHGQITGGKIHGLRIAQQHGHLFTAPDAAFVQQVGQLVAAPI